MGFGSTPPQPSLQPLPITPRRGISMRTSTMAQSAYQLRKTIKSPRAEIQRMSTVWEPDRATFRHQLTAREATIQQLREQQARRVDPLVEKVFTAHAQSLEAVSNAIRSIQNQF